MTINVSEALDTDTAERITIDRYTEGSYVDGIYVAPSANVIVAMASVQQPSPQQIEQMTSGERSSDPRLFICNKRLQEADTEAGIRADLINYEGKKYKVKQVLAWGKYGHTKAVATRDKRSEV